MFDFELKVSTPVVLPLLTICIKRSAITQMSHVISSIQNISDPRPLKHQKNTIVSKLCDIIN